MPLSLDPGNIMKFATYFSPIFIPSFLLVTSAIEANLKGVAYIIGLMITYALGYLMKFFFRKQFGDRYLRRPFNTTNGSPPGWTATSMPDYCSVFEGPFDHSTIGNVNMPSLVSMFHSFTICYITLSVATNTTIPIGGILFIIGLSINAIIHLYLRKTMLCDSWKGIILGFFVGGGLGAAWWAALKAINPTWLFFGHDKQKKCKLGKTKFKCTYS